MSDASTAHGDKPTEPTNPKPLFPSEGDFSTVVPLSQVGPAPFTAARSADDGRPSEAEWAREDRRAERGAGAREEEETLVPARARRRRIGRADSPRVAGQKPWPVTAAAVLLSVLAGVAAGSYLVWSKRPAAVVNPNAQETAAEAPAPAHAAPPAETSAPRPGGEEIAAAPVEEAAPVAPGAPARATDPKPEGATEPAPRAAKSTPAAEPVTREATPARPRVERSAPAPRPVSNETPARRAETTAAPRPPRPAVAGRRLPVSAPPPSAKSKTVIQWP